MAGVTVEFGAKDTGLQQTLQTVQNELTALKRDLSDGSLSFDELNQAMRKVAQAERLESQLQRIANETEQAGNEAVGAANDFDKLDREMDQVAVNSGTTGVSMGQLRSAFTTLTGVIASVTAAFQGMRAAFNYMQDGVNLAMSLEETMNRVNQIFGASGMQIQQWAQGSMQGLAMTKAQAMDAASEFAMFGQSAGLAGNDLVGFSTRLTRLAADMASFKDTKPEEAILAIGAALRGESEPIRRFNVLLNESVLKTEAFKLGLIETTTQALTPQQRILAAYNVIMAQTTTLQDDFARTADSASNQTKILKASLEELQTEVGQRVVPAWEKFVNYLNNDFIPAAGGVMMTLDQLGNAIGRGVDSLGELDRKIKGVGERNNALGATYRAVNTSLMGFNQLMHDTFTTFTPVGYALQTISNNTEQYKNQTDSAGESAGKAAKRIEALGDNIESLNSGMGAANTSTMTLTNNLSGLGTGGTFTNVNSEAEKFSGLLGDSSIKLNDVHAALGTMNPKLTAQNALYGEINTTLGNSQAQLGAQLSIIESTIGKQRESNSEEDKKNAKIAEREALLAQQQAQALEEYNLQIQINEAIAAGNAEQAGMLETKQELVSLADQIAQKTGLSTEKARQLAAEYLISKNNADATTEASKSLADRIEEADDEAKQLRQTIGDIASKDMERGAKGLRERIKEAREEMKGLETIIGQVGGMSLDDMLKKMGLDPQSFDTIGQKLNALEGNLEALKGMDAADVTPFIDDDGLTTSIADIKSKLADLAAPANATPKINQEDFARQVNDIVQQLNGLEDQPITTELDAGDSIQNIRSALEEPVQVQIDESAFDAAVASMNAEITNNFRGGDGGDGGDATGGQGGEGGRGGDAIADISQVVNILNPWTQVITAIRDRLPLQALS